MAEVVLDYRAIIAAMETELRSVVNHKGDQAFPVVQAGEPQQAAVGFGPYAYFWYLGRVDSLAGAETFGNVMYAVVFNVVIVWAIQADTRLLAEWEAQIATIDTDIRRRFRANSTLNGEGINDLDISDSEVGFIRFGQAARGKATHRALEMRVTLHNLEGEPIHATPS